MDRIERCEKKFGELFGGKPVQREGTDAEFMRILQRFIFGEVSYTGSLDAGLNEHKYILPGLGDAGDRIFGTL